MKPILATVRVRAGRAPELVGARATAETEPLARALAAAALGAAAAELAEPGTYRVEVAGQPKHPQVTVTRLAGPGQTVVAALLVRDGVDSVHVSGVHVSLKDGAAPGATEHAQQVLAEAAATAARTLPVGAERALELVLD